MTDQAPADQHLEMVAIHVTTDRHAHDPPVLNMMLDVVHVESGTQWRQQLSVTRELWVEMMQLLAYAAANEKVKWKA